ncbi:MAG: alpha/beta hydrolase [Victivallales bacterium]|nr:alpha/beta hydrolase [Victivallales bacterium]
MKKISLWPNKPEITTSAGGPSITCFLHEEPMADGLPRPAMLVVPGGGYHCVCESSEGTPIARHFMQLGYNCFVLDYRVYPDGVFPNCVADAARAVKLIRANAKQFGIDPQRVAGVGFSAGGHLVACLGTGIVDEVEASVGDDADGHSARLDGMILCYPVTSFRKKDGHLQSGVGFLDKHLEALGDKYDPANRLDERTPPTFLWHTMTDQMVPVDGSIAMMHALKDKGVLFSFHLFPLGDHGMLLAKQTDAEAWPELATKFLLAAWRKRSASPEEFWRCYTNATQIELEKKAGLAEG